MTRPTTLTRLPRLGVAVLALALGTTTPVTIAFAAPAAAGAAAGAPAGAPDAATKKAAREAYGAGEKAYGAGDYKGAHDQFKKAYELIPTIHAQYWMAMCLSYGTDAGAAYDALATVAGSPDAEKLGEEKTAVLSARLAEVKKTPATVSIDSTPAGADVAVDGVAQAGMTPLTATVPAGLHKISVAMRGFETFEAEFVAKPGQKIDQKAELKTAAAAPAAAAPAPAPVEAPPAPPPEPGKETSMVPAYITLGVAAVGAGVGTVFGIKALGAKSDFDKNPTSARADTAERDALIADMAFGVALTLGITGVVLLSSGDDSSEVSARATPHPARARLDIAPVVTGSIQGAAARLTF